MADLVHHHGDEIVLARRGVAIGPEVPVRAEVAAQAGLDVHLARGKVAPAQLVGQCLGIPGSRNGGAGEVAMHGGGAGGAEHAGRERLVEGGDPDGDGRGDLSGPEIHGVLKGGPGLGRRLEADVGDGEGGGGSSLRDEGGTPRSHPGERVAGGGPHHEPGHARGRAAAHCD